MTDQALLQCALPQVVLDTNTVLDLALFRDPQATALGAALAAGGLRWIWTARMRVELELVLGRARLGRWQPAAHAEAVLAFADGLAASMPAPAPGAGGVPACRDPADQMFVDLAWHQRCSWLISRDKALLALRRRCSAMGIEVVTPAVWGQRSAAGGPMPALAART